MCAHVCAHVCAHICAMPHICVWHGWRALCMACLICAIRVAWLMRATRLARIHTCAMSMGAMCVAGLMCVTQLLHAQRLRSHLHFFFCYEHVTDMGHVTHTFVVRVLRKGVSPGVLNTLVVFTHHQRRHFCVWHDSFIRVTWLIPTLDMTHSYVWHDSFIRVTWLIHTCDMTHSYVWHNSFIRVT